MRDGRATLSPEGQIVAEEWRRTEAVRPNVLLDAWVVMPDYLHGIIRITHGMRSATPRSYRPSRLHPGSLGAIIGQFKSVAPKRVRAAGHQAFGWQPRFHEDVVRDRGHLEAIRRYIANNPRKWRIRFVLESSRRPAYAGRPAPEPANESQDHPWLTGETA